MRLALPGFGTCAVIAAACGFHPTASETSLGSDASTTTAADSSSNGSGSNTIPPDALLVPTGLIAYYPMDELTTTTITDATGRGHDGQCSSAPCPTVGSGKIGSGYVFNGSDVITIPAPSGNELNTTSAFSVAFWVSFALLPGNTGDEQTEYSCPVNKPYGTTNSDSWQLCYSGTNAAWFYGTQAGGFDIIPTGTGTTISTKTWYHVAITWDGAQKDIWVNGTSIATSSVSGIDFDANSLKLGADLYDEAASATFAGSIDDVRIYDRALSSSEIATLADQ